MDWKTIAGVVAFFGLIGWMTGLSASLRQIAKDLSELKGALLMEISDRRPPSDPWR